MSIVKQLFICLVLVAGAAAGWYVYQNPQVAGLARESAEGAAAGGGGQSRGGNRIPGLAGGGGAINVITAPVEAETGGESLTALGTARAARSVALFPQVTGIVTEILFQPGQSVPADAVLVRLQDDEQEVAVERARVALEQARETLARSETLAKSKTISAVALSDAGTAVQLAEIELRTAEIALERHVIDAPFAGVVGLTDISIGDLVTSTTEIAILDDLSTLRVRFEAPERWAPRIELGQPITATVQGMPGEDISGRITGIDSRIDEQTRTLRLEAELANPGAVLKPGMAVAVEMQFDSSRQLSVPTLAVQWDRRGSYVWKVAGNAAERAEIVIIRRQSGVVVVEGELAAGDRIVVEGVQRLRPGSQVVDVGDIPEDVDAPQGESGPAISRAGNRARAS